MKYLHQTRTGVCRTLHEKVLLAFLLLAAFASTSHQCHAQGAPIDIWVASGVSGFHSKSFSTFATSFNSANESVIASPLEGFGPGTCTDWGISFVFGDGIDADADEVIEFSFYASNQHTKTKVEYTDDAQRVFDLKRHQFGFEMGVGPKLGNAVLSGCWGVLMGNSILDSYYIYPDGTESHGQEKMFNGIFDEFNAYGYLGAKFTYRIDQIKLMAKVRYGLDMFRRNYFTDHNMARGLNLTQGWWPTELPTDVAAYEYAVDNLELYNGDYLENRFSGFTAQVGVGFSFTK